MGKSPKTANDDRMLFRPCVQIPRFAKSGQLLHQAQAQLLVRQVFAMFQRQIDEHAFDRPQASIMFLCQRMARGLAGQAVGLKGTAGIPKHIAGKLVQQDDERQTTLRMVAPVRELAAHGALGSREEAGADLMWRSRLKTTQREEFFRQLVDLG